jgi:hypothetical protein
LWTRFTLKTRLTLRTWLTLRTRLTLFTLRTRLTLRTFGALQASAGLQIRNVSFQIRDPSQQQRTVVVEFVERIPDLLERRPVVGSDL